MAETSTLTLVWPAERRLLNSKDQNKAGQRQSMAVKEFWKSDTKQGKN